MLFWSKFLKYCTDGKLVQVQLGKSGHGSIETKKQKMHLWIMFLKICVDLDSNDQSKNINFREFEYRTFFYFLGYHRTGKILYNNYVNKFFFLIPTILCNIVLCNFVNLFCRNHVRRRICIFQFSQRFCWFYFLKKNRCVSVDQPRIWFILYI